MTKAGKGGELPPVCTDSVKKPLCGIYFVLSGVARRQRRHSSFILDALMVIEVNVSVNQIVRLVECLWFMPVNIFRFQD